MSENQAKSTSRDEALKKIKGKASTEISSSVIAKGIIDGDKTSLSKAITLLESTHPDHQKISSDIVQLCLPQSGNSFRLGITGVPGVGKSTFIETFGNKLLEKGKRVAVLAIDPSSQKTGGSILGDKTRMQTLISKDDIFIRPSPASDNLGGVARATKEAIILCEASGYDFIIVETVGVGQSETEVHSMVDFFLLLMLSGAGDELQGIKRGIMEMADGIVITKADGDNEKKALRAAVEYKSAVHLLSPPQHFFPIQIKTCSALNDIGIDKVLEMIESFHEHSTANGYLLKNRSDQNVKWMHQSLKSQIVSSFYSNTSVAEELKNLENQVKEGKLSPFSAVNKLLENL